MQGREPRIESRGVWTAQNGVARDATADKIKRVKPPRRRWPNRKYPVGSRIIKQQQQTRMLAACASKRFPTCRLLDSTWRIDALAKNLFRPREKERCEEKIKRAGSCKSGSRPGLMNASENKDYDKTRVGDRNIRVVHRVCIAVRAR